MDLVVNSLISNEICPICFEKVGSSPEGTDEKIEEIAREIFKSLCSHYYHPECIAKWRLRGHDDCPVCRGPLSNEPNQQEQPLPHQINEEEARGDLRDALEYYRQREAQADRLGDEDEARYFGALADAASYEHQQLPVQEMARDDVEYIDQTPLRPHQQEQLLLHQINVERFDHYRQQEEQERRLGHSDTADFYARLVHQYEPWQIPVQEVARDDIEYFESYRRQEEDARRLGHADAADYYATLARQYEHGQLPAQVVVFDDLDIEMEVEYMPEIEAPDQENNAP